VPWGRVAGIGALALVVFGAALLIFGSSGSATYNLMFAEADQLVRGDQVQVGGVPVGSVTQITLTKAFKARVTIEIESSLAPLHRGTTAQVRVPSLSSVANRYIALSPGPNNAPDIAEGGTLPVGATKEVTDLDQLFDTLNPATRKGLQQFIQGMAQQYENESKPFGESVEFFSPALSATSKVFAQLVHNEPVFTRFLIEAAKAVTVVGARSEQLEGLISNGATTFEAVAAHQRELTAAFTQLPITLHQGNETFADLPATLDALTKLIETSKPTTPALITLLQKLRPLVHTATGPVSDLATAFSKPGKDNDLTELARAVPALLKQLETTSPASVKALEESVPITAFFGPYSPDLEAATRTFAQAGSFYDANGHYAHVEPVFPDFNYGAGETLRPANSTTEVLEGLITNQLKRCPGGATEPSEDGSSPFEDSGLLSCDPLETPK